MLWPTATSTATLKDQILDQATNDGVLAVAASVENGTVLAENAPATPRTYDKLKIVLDPDYQLQPGQSVNFFVSLGFRDPYNLEVVSPPLAPANYMYNTITASGDLMITGQAEPTPLSADQSSFDRLIPLNETISFSKTSRATNTGVGEQISFILSLSTASIAKARMFTNPVIVDFVPDGLTFQSIYFQDKIWREGNADGSGKATYQYVPNYNNTGRPAVVIDLPDFKAGDATEKTMQMFFLINPNSASSWEADWQNTNMNRAYFTADEWLPKPEAVASTTMIGDLFDMDQDGNTAETFLGAQTPYVAVLGEEIQAQKYIRQDPADQWGPGPLILPYDSPFQYQLTVKNGQMTAVPETWIYDLLPYLGDKEYYFVDGAYPDRNSAFSPMLTGPIVVGYKPENVTIHYRTDKYPPVNPQSALADTQLWKTADQIGDWNQVTAFRIHILNIGPHETFNFTVNAKTITFNPEYVTNGREAHNNFAASYDKVNYAQSNTVSIGLRINLPVEKIWQGGTPESHVPVTVDLYRDGERVPNPDYNPADPASDPFTRLILDETNEWKGLFENLRLRDELGKLYTYTVQERETILHYNSVVSGDVQTGFAIKNTYQSPVIPITGEKIWYDGPNADNAVIYMQLYRRLRFPPDPANNPWEAKGTPARLDATTNPAWIHVGMNDQYSFEGLEYEFMVEEVDTPWTVWPEGTGRDRYIPQMETIILEDENGNITGWTFKLTNQYVPPVGDIPAYKHYLGGADDNRPTMVFDLYRYLEGETPEDALSVTQTVLENGVETQQQVYRLINAAVNYTVNFENMPLNNMDGVPYHYLVRERDLQGLTEAELTALGLTLNDQKLAANYQLSPALSGNQNLWNVYRSPMTTITATKKWENLPEGQTAPNINLQLLRDGVPFLPTASDAPAGFVNPVALPSGTLSYTWTVPATDFYEGVYNYSVVERDMPAHYIVTLGAVETDEQGHYSQLITNRYDPSSLVLRVYKQWVDGPEPKPPVWMRVTQYLDGAATGFQLTAGIIDSDVDATTSATYRWVVPGGTVVDGVTKPYTYTINEYQVGNDPVVAQGTAQQAGDYQVVQEEQFIHTSGEIQRKVINTYTVPYTSVLVSKTWLDAAGSQMAPVKDIEFTLMRQVEGGTPEEAGVQTLFANADPYQLVWDNQPLTDSAARPYRYYLEESGTPANFIFTSGTQVLSADRATLTVPTYNRYQIPTGRAIVTKVWEGGPLIKPDVHLALGRNGTTATYGVTIQNGDALTQVFSENLPFTDAQGNPYTFTLVESPLANYTIKEPVPSQTYNPDAPWPDNTLAFTITNVYNKPTTDYSVTKEFVNGEKRERPDVYIQLLRDGAVFDQENVEEFVTLVPPVTTHTWTGLDAVDDENTPYTYSVREMKADGITPVGDEVYNNYTSTVRDNVIINTYVIPTLDITVTKEWKGGAQPYPPARVELWRTETDTGDVVRMREATLTHLQPSYTWANLLGTRTNGAAYTYDVVEVDIPDNYTAQLSGNEQDGYLLTNTYDPPTIDIPVQKVWDGGPAAKPTVQMVLMQSLGGADAQQVGDTLVFADGKLEDSWKDMPLTDGDGVPYTYTVEEILTDPFYAQQQIQGDAESGFVVTNKYVSPLMDLTATKVWNNAPGETPPVSLTLLRNGVPLADPLYTNPQQVSQATQNKASWFGLPINDQSGVPYTYDVREDIIPDGYIMTSLKTTDQKTHTITNDFQPIRLQLSPTKELTGAALAPSQFTFRLLSATGDMLAESTNLQSGGITFPEQLITKPGQHVFFVKEVKGTDNTITYDRTLYTITMQVSREENGRLLVDNTAMVRDGEVYTGSADSFLKFVNAKTETPTTPPTPKPTDDPGYKAISVSLDAVKQLRGRALKEGEFAFILRDYAGNELETVRNRADGSIDFTSRRFSRPGTFLYTIQELEEKLQGVRYDSTRYTARVEITQAGGELQARVEYLRDGTPYDGTVAFVNRYSPPQTGDSTLTMILLLLLAAAALGGGYLWLKHMDKKKRESANKPPESKTE